MIATQEELARLTGIDRTTISAIENNRLFLSSPYALIFKEVLGCSLDDLFERVDGKIDDKDSKDGSGAGN
jgi:DNA-binding XRE family transcriptional regulator